MSIRGALGLASVMACGLAAAAGPLGIRVEPLYEGPRTSGMVALVATVSNSGPDAAGAIEISAEGMLPIRFPVSLPRGSVKRVRVMAPQNPYYGSPSVVLETNRGIVRALIPPTQAEVSEDHPAALMVGGASGELNFLEEHTGLFVAPEEAPERPVAYASMRFVLLGEGAERMTDAAVAAVQAWAETGGTVVLVGGASSPLLFDRRWTGFLPMAVEGARPVRVATNVERLWGRPMPNVPIAAVFGKLAPGSRIVADGPMPLVIERALGAGRVVLFAVNPFEGPLRTWPGRKKMFERHVPSVGSPGMMGLQSQPWDSSASVGPAARPIGSFDPFTVELPATGTVLMLLAGYVILVVPVNFIVLRRLRRGEWAWVTSPLLSLGFASVFFSFAADLYKTPMGRAVTGTLYLDSRLATSYLVGNAQMFVPRGGTYDLRFDQVDWVAPVGFDLYGYSGRSESRIDLGLIDNGTLHARRASFPNLAFHQFGFSEQVPTGGWLTVRGKVENGKVRLVLTNGSPYTLEGRLGRGDANAQTFGRLGPGATAAVQMDGKSVPSVVDVFGTIEGLAAGPRIGRDYSAPNALQLAAHLEVAKG